MQYLTHFKNEKSHGMIDDLDNIVFISSNVNSSRQEALLYVFEDNEAVIKMTIKGRSPTMRRVSRTHRVALDWLLDGINLDTKIQIKYIDTKNQLADILTKGNISRDEWNHLLCWFNISYFSATNCLEVMSKRTQKDAGEERVTAKSKPMMNLVSRCSVRDPNVLASTASESPEKTRHESQVPLSSWTEQHHRTGRPVEDAYSSSYSEWNIDEKWSSQERKSDEMLKARTVRPVNNKPVCSLSTQTGLSLMTMIWTLTPPQNQTRKMLDQSPKDATQDSNKHSLTWRNVYVFDIGSICIHGKELPGNFTFHQKYRKQSHFETDVRHI